MAQQRAKSTSHASEVLYLSPPKAGKNKRGLIIFNVLLHTAYQEL